MRGFFTARGMRRCALWVAFFCMLGASDRPWAAQVTLLYTGDTQSFLEVCGCTDNQLGGVARRATAVRDAREAHPDALLLDAGELFAGDTALDRLRVAVHLRAMRAMGYDAANAGADAFLFGRAFFKAMRDTGGVWFVSANARVSGKAPTPAVQVFKRQGLRIAVLGVGGKMEKAVGAMGDSARSVVADVKMAPPAAAVQAALKGLHGSVDLVVVLSDLDRATERELVRAVPSVNVVISARTREDVERVGDAVLLGTQPEGKALGRAVLTLDGGRVTDVHAQPVWLSERLAEDENVKQLVANFYAQVNASPSLQQVGRPRFEGFAQEAAVTAGKNGYAGSAACQACHAREYADWMQTPHANAFNTLLQRQKHYQPDCVTCHTTGFGYPTGFRIGDRASELTGVQCEVCHGPGGRHVQRPEADNIRRTPPEALCRRCHDVDQSPDFGSRYAEMVTEVNHSGFHASATQAVQQAVERASDGRPLVELFVMADCPYGIRAETALAPVFRMLGDQIEFHLYFIADEVGVTPSVSAPQTRAQRQGSGCSGPAVAGSGRFRSLHGDPEIAEGIRQTAVMQLYPNRYWDYILCRDREGIESDWRACAQKAGLDPDRIAALAESPQGADAFAQNIRRGNDLDVHASPTLRVNGREVDLTSDAVGLTRLLCREQGVNAALCAETPACSRDGDCEQPGKVGLCIDPGSKQAKCAFRDPVPFRVTIVNDAACELCETYPFVRSTLSLFPGARFQTVDVHSDSGRALVARYGLDRAPSFVLGGAFEKTAHFKRFEHIVRRADDAFVPDVRMTPVSVLLNAPADSGRVDLFLNLSLEASWDLAGQMLQWAGAVNAPDRVRLHFLGIGEDIAFRRLQQKVPQRVGDVLMCRVLARQRQAMDDACFADVGGMPEATADSTDAALWDATRVRAQALGVRPDMAPTAVIDGRVVLSLAGLGQVEKIFYRLHPDLARRDRKMGSDSNAP